MSLCLRPVVEQWKESLTYSSRDTDITDVLDGIAELAVVERACNDYNGMRVFWVGEGANFLSYLINTEVADIISALEENEVIMQDFDEERERQLSDVAELKSYATRWLQTSIDPQDGSLRLYCD